MRQSDKIKVVGHLLGKMLGREMGVLCGKTWLRGLVKKVAADSVTLSAASLSKEGWLLNRMVGWNGSRSWAEEEARSYHDLPGTKDCESETHGFYWSQSWSGNGAISMSFRGTIDMSLERRL